MRHDHQCPGCGQPVVPAEPDPLNERGEDAGVVVTFTRTADGEDLATKWHPACRSAERRRAERRRAQVAGTDVAASLEPPLADLLEQVRGALR